MEKKCLRVNMGQAKDYGVWHEFGPTEEGWKRSLRCLSDRSWNLLWWLLMLDTQEMQWHYGPFAL